MKYLLPVLLLLNYVSAFSRDAGHPDTTLMPDWVVIEGTNITYHFQDTTGWSDSTCRYILVHERAYQQLNEIFKATLPKKLSFYIWNDRKLAEQVSGCPLGFTNTELCVCQVARDQTTGHEMMHALSYWGWDTRPVNKTRFITEGVCVAFDLSKRNKVQMARIAVRGTNIHSVSEIWTNGSEKEEILYPVGGAFVAYLYKKSTPEQFKALMKDQMMVSAEHIYGKERLNELVNEFDQLLELK